jgi:UDP-N-acetylmuramoylalanine--D-glutamate ligase
MPDSTNRASSYRSLVDELSGKRATVMGLGSFGGGIAAANYLAVHGAAVTVSDQKNEAELAASIQRLDSRIELCLGGHDWSHFEDADIVVLNPAIAPRNEYIQRLDATEKWLTSEIELFCQLNPGRVIAVTGSNGKSTTTSFIYSMLQSAGVSSWLGGNIGVSLLDQVHEIQSTDWVVLELSSFQLHGLRRIGFRPDIAVITNLAPNHLDWHETESHYFASKYAIVENQTSSDSCVVNGTDSRLVDWRPNSRVSTFGAPVGDHVVMLNSRVTIHVDNVCESFETQFGDRFPGNHNRLNLQAAIAAVTSAGLSTEQIQSSIHQLSSLEFRLQREAEVNGILFVNDAKSTTPESAIAALNAFDRPIVLLAGGSDKGVNLDEFATAIVQKTKAVAVMGAVADQLAAAIETHASINVQETGGTTHAPLLAQLDSFEASFLWAVEHAQPGDVVLLSAGCASFGWFANYRDRGEQFARLVAEFCYK